MMSKIQHIYFKIIAPHIPLATVSSARRAQLGPYFVRPTLAPALFSDGRRICPRIPRKTHRRTGIWRFREGEDRNSDVPILVGLMEGRTMSSVGMRLRQREERHGDISHVSALMTWAIEIE